MIFCFNYKINNLAEIAYEIETQSGIKVMASSPTDTVQGWLDAVSVPAGTKKGKCLSGLEYTSEPHTCVKVNFYEQNEDPIIDPADPDNRKSHRTKLRKPNLTEDKLNKIERAFENNSSKKKVRLLKKILSQPT